ncbi:hypothetical protein B0H13DRAFT_1899413 [Mycena leptocephala]|nr:hypothetical protein B0H13DRAFT_1899413 [Mycena leptocephala]
MAFCFPEAEFQRRPPSALLTNGTKHKIQSGHTPNCSVFQFARIATLLIEQPPPGTEEAALVSDLQDGVTMMRMYAVESLLIITVYAAGLDQPQFYAQVSHEDDPLILELTAEAIQLGLLELCIAATFLLQCGKKRID